MQLMPCLKPSSKCVFEVKFCCVLSQSLHLNVNIKCVYFVSMQIFQLSLCVCHNLWFASSSTSIVNTGRPVSASANLPRCFSCSWASPSGCVGTRTAIWRHSNIHTSVICFAMQTTGSNLVLYRKYSHYSGNSR